MNKQRIADNMHNQIQKQRSRFYFCVPFAVVVTILFAIGCATTPPSADNVNVSDDKIDASTPELVDAQHTDIGDGNSETSEDNDSHRSILAIGEPDSAPTFPTFNNTGGEICTNDEGLPLIYLFSSSLCAHCEWGGGAYDFIVRFLASDGLIEAHHYDLLSGDDLLTEEIETKIPADRLEVYFQGNPKDLVPYYNFGCAYDRIGNGYEKENDLVAEGEEMRRVIEALVQMVSEGE